TMSPVIPASIPLLEDTRRIDQSRWTAVLDIEAEERPGEAAHGAVLGALHPSERVFEEALREEGIGIQEEHVTALPGRGVRNVVCVREAGVVGQSDDPNRVGDGNL